MELIYLNRDMVEEGVLSDFSLDLAYGKDENDFEIKSAENEMEQGYYWYIKDTSYGGVVDEIAKVSNEEEVTYRGRSLEGIIASYSSYSLQGGDFYSINGNSVILRGKPSEIAYEIIRELGIPFTLLTPSEDEMEIDVTVELGTDIYQLFRAIKGYKVVLGYDNGWTIALTGAIDYTTDEYFDASVYTLNVSSNDRIPNHLIGAYKTDDKTYVKHLYFDADGNVQPYYQVDSIRTGQKPLHDAEYERVEGTKVLDGLDEVIEVIEGGSTIENYDLVTKQTETDGNTPFTDNVPSDWESNWQEYYQTGWDEDKKETTYVSLPQNQDYSPITISDLQWWAQNWGSYYKRVWDDDEQRYVYQQLSDSDLTEPPTYYQATPRGVLPADWKDNWQAYYRFVSTGVYEKFSGLPVYSYVKQDKAGTMWSDDKGSMYRYWARKKWTITIYAQRNGKWTKADTVTVKDSLSLASPRGSNHTYAWWKNREGNSFVVEVQVGQVIGKTKYVIGSPTTYKEDYISLTDYCDTLGISLQSVKWGDFEVYVRNQSDSKAPSIDEPTYLPTNEDNYPDATQTYYEPSGYAVPPFRQGQVYRKVEDHYTNLIATMLQKYDEIRQNAVKIEPRINANIMEFDVGDVIGAVHPFTGEMLQSTIQKKIVKITETIDISYEV